MLFRDQHTVQSDDVRRSGPGVPATGEPQGPDAGLGRRPEGARTTLALRLAVIVLFALAVTIPFINQAFHIDDAIFWDFARYNLESPFSLHLPDYRMMGESFSEWRDTHPPVDALYLALLMRLTGSEAAAPLHAGFIIFPAVAGIAMFFLGRRFTRNAVLAALLLLATPVVMVLSHSLMADVPMMAVWLAATALYVYGVDRDDGRLLALSGLAAALAVMTGYQALALVVLLPAYPAFLGRLSPRNLAPLLIPLAVFGLYALASLAQYGELPRFSHSRGTSFRSEHLLDRIEGLLLHTGGVSLFPLALAAAFSLRRKRYLALPLVAGAAVALGLLRYRDGGLTVAAAVFYISFLAAAGMMLTGVVSETVIQFNNARKRRPVDTGFLFLAFWLLSLAAMIIILLPHVSAKYILAFIAPIVLITLRELELGLTSARWFQVLAGGMLVLTLGTGTLLSIADYRLADGYREFAASVKGRYETPGTVWFVGEWGFRHYMEAEGYRYLTTTDASPAPGDLIISPSVADWPLAPSLGNRVEQLETVEIGWTVPLRLMSFEAEAGFYGTNWGLLPYALDDVPVESFEVLLVGS
ncbi:MAG: glycosyltransferase family 39 protein [Thermoleophilia bacterium]